MKIKTASFVISNTDIEKCPDDKKPEYAFIGRSNVGKSSLINMLTNNKKLAKISGRPGKTQLINHFIINDEWYLVDLPGYGYAKAPKSVQKSWGPMIEIYLSTRSNLRGVVLILDIRRTPGEQEHNLIDWLHYYNLAIIMILTKADKLSKSNRIKQHRIIGNTLAVDVDDLIVFSAKSRLGKEAVWKTIEQLPGFYT